MPIPFVELPELKARLGKLLAAGDTDFQAILEMAGAIAQQEPGVVRFTTDAAMVRRLGRELVAKKETALGELVKNAYDADATSCDVRLDARAGASPLEVVDDGSGMTRDEVVDGFMRLASDAKAREPYSRRYRRSRAGKKGIGRFATERLGDRVTIVTQTAADERALVVTIDWRAFEAGLDIGLIANTIAEGPKERAHGTRLTIWGLRDAWTAADLRRVGRYLETLRQPTARGVTPPPAPNSAPPDSEPDGPRDPGFRVRMTRGAAVVVAGRPAADADGAPDGVPFDPDILGHAVAIIDATVGADGRAHWSLTPLMRERLDVRVVEEPISLAGATPLAHARNVELRAYYYIKSPEFYGKALLSSIRKQLDEYGGIQVYRNGYRVPPYGDRHDDWLGLDAKRRFYAPVNTKAFIGYVALTDPTGTRFEETSSREGLIETPAFDEVRDLAGRVLEAAALRIESARGLGRKTPKTDDATSGSRAAAAADDAVVELKRAVAVLEDGKVPDARQRAVLRRAVERFGAAAEAAAEAARERDTLLEELSLMRILASMGLTTAEFAHDFAHLAETLELGVDAVERTAAVATDTASASKAATAEFTAALARLREQFRHVRAYTAHFGQMVAHNASRELAQIDLYAFARGFADDMRAMFRKRGLELVVERPKVYDVRTIPMHPSEWSSILLNLLTNAIKASARAGRVGRFRIRVGFDGPGAVFLEFCDNGDGIPPEHRARVFDAFFTTTGGSPIRSTEDVQAVGTGLGLKIVADIARGAGGGAQVVDAPDGYATCIRVTVPAAQPDAADAGAATAETDATDAEDPEEALA